MAKKHAGGQKTLAQKLGSSKGVGLDSKMEKSAGLPYKGVSLGSGISHGTHGLLAGSGQKKNAKVPGG